jgi:hypothetical protein
VGTDSEARAIGRIEGKLDSLCAGQTKLFALHESLIKGDCPLGQENARKICDLNKAVIRMGILVVILAAAVFGAERVYKWAAGEPDPRPSVVATQ